MYEFFTRLISRSEKNNMDFICISNSGNYFEQQRMTIKWLRDTFEFNVLTQSPSNVERQNIFAKMFNFFNP